MIDMTILTQEFTCPMHGQGRMEDITGEIEARLRKSKLREGAVTIFVRHTTASVLIIENEPGLHEDTRKIWDELIPARDSWRHNTRNPGEDNAHSHLRGQIQGQSLTIPFAAGELLLGTWQRIALIDFDTRARPRQVVVQFQGE